MYTCVSAHVIFKTNGYSHGSGGLTVVLICVSPGIHRWDVLSLLLGRVSSVCTWDTTPYQTCGLQSPSLVWGAPFAVKELFSRRQPHWVTPFYLTSVSVSGPNGRRLCPLPGVYGSGSSV